MMSLRRNPDMSLYLGRDSGMVFGIWCLIAYTLIVWVIQKIEIKRTFSLNTPIVSIFASFFYHLLVASFTDQTLSMRLTSARN